MARKTKAEKKTEELFERIEKTSEEYYEKEEQMRKDYYDAQERLVLDYLVSDGTVSSFCAFLNGASSDEDYIEAKDYDCEISYDFSEKIMDVILSALKNDEPFTFSRDALVRVLDSAYEETDALIPYKESPLFEENISLIEDFIAENVLDPALEEKTSSAVKMMKTIDSSVISPEERVKKKRAFLSSSDALEEDWDRDVKSLEKALGISYESASQVIYANAQVNTGLDHPAFLIPALLRAEQNITSRLDGGLILFSGCSLSSDLNREVSPSDPSSLQKVKDSVLYLFGRDFPGRYCYGPKRVPDEESLHLFEKLSFGYDASSVSSLQSLIKEMGFASLEKSVCSKEDLSRELKKNLGYKSEVFGCDVFFMEKILFSKEMDTVEKREALVSFMNTSKDFYTEESEPVWDDFLSQQLLNCYNESNIENFSRKDLFRDFSYLMTAPAPFLDKERKIPLLSSDERESITGAVIESSASYGPSFEKTKNTFAAFISLKEFILDDVLASEQSSFLIQKLYECSEGRFFEDPASSALSDRKTFSKFAEGLLSFDDPSVALEKAENKTPSSPVREEEEER